MTIFPHASCRVDRGYPCIRPPSGIIHLVVVVVIGKCFPRHFRVVLVIWSLVSASFSSSSSAGETALGAAPDPGKPKTPHVSRSRGKKKSGKTRWSRSHSSPSLALIIIICWGVGSFKERDERCFSLCLHIARSLLRGQIFHNFQMTKSWGKFRRLSNRVELDQVNPVCPVV